MNQLDKDIEDLRELKKTLMALDRLNSNPDFKRVIFDEFLVKHPLALVMSKGQLPLDPETNIDINRQLDCVALFKTYLDKLTSQIPEIDYKISQAEDLRDERTRNT